MLRSAAEANQDDSSAPDRTTLRALFDREEGNLLRYAVSLTGRLAVAEEIVQEVFLQLHARWAEVQNPEAWLIRCVRNRSFHYLRVSRRELLEGDQTSHGSAGDEARESRTGLLQSQASGTGTAGRRHTSHSRYGQSDWGESPEKDLERMETIEAMRTLLNDLSPEDRQLVQLKYFEGLKYREISQRTGLTVSNVGFRLHFLLKQLASRLPELGIEELP